MSFPRAAIALALVLAADAAVAAVSVATGATPGVSPHPSLLSPRPVEPEMKRFAARRRALERRRAGVPPIRGPIDLGTATNRFGAHRGGHVHGGQDVFAPTGTPLYAVHDAVVLETGSDGARGNHIAFYAPRTRRTYAYFHMAEPARVSAGERVRAGQRIAAVGCTGSCDGAHLHLEAYAGRGTRGRALDPLPELRRWRRAAVRT